MEKATEFVAIEGRNIRLDRAGINHHGQIQLPQDPPQSGDRNHDDDSTTSRQPQSSLHDMRASIREKRHGAAIKIKKTLSIGKSPEIDNDLDREAALLADPISEESESRLVNKLPLPEKHTLKNFIHDPIDTVKSKVSSQGSQQAAENIAAKEISHGQDVDLVNAHKAMQSAEDGSEKEKAVRVLDELMKERQNTFVRWTLDRHISKVRILPQATFVLKKKEEFQRKDDHGRVIVDWRAYAHHLTDYAAHQYGGQYIGYGMDHPSPSKESIMPNIERLVVASAPLQELIMTTRRVFRWENRAETMKYLMIYTALWTTNLILPGFSKLSVIVYLVLERRFHKKSMEDLRHDVERTEDRQQTAMSLTEYITKEGEEQWADNILQSLGPWLMIQLSDLANSFEVMRNFYEWRAPSRTVATLVIFLLAIMTTVFVPAWLYIKALTLGIGILFFGLFPLASHFPEYRLLASLPKRIFWNIPTHAEWAVKAIQAEGSRYQQEHEHEHDTHPSTPHAQDAAHEYGSYTAHYNKTKGHAIISSSSVHFSSTTHDKAVHWTLPYSQIERMEKMDRVVGKSLPKPKTDCGKDLKLRSKSGEEWVVTNVDKRDQVFSQILGFSDTVWQVVW